MLKVQKRKKRRDKIMKKSNLIWQKKKVGPMSLLMSTERNRQN